MNRRRVQVIALAASACSEHEPIEPPIDAIEPPAPDAACIRGPFPLTAHVAPPLSADEEFALSQCEVSATEPFDCGSLCEVVGRAEIDPGCRFLFCETTLAADGYDVTGDCWVHSRAPGCPTR